MSPPRSRIRDGRAPGGRHHSFRRRLSARPDNGDAPLDRCARAASGPGLIQVATINQDTGFITAPSGTTPWVANRHKAIRSRRAIATTMTLRMRFPVPPTRSRNQMT